MKKNFCLITLLLTCLLSLEAQEPASAQLFEISNYTIQNAKWSKPEGANPPVLLSYEAVFYLTPKTRINALVKASDFSGIIIPPYEFMKDGDQVELLKEGYFADGRDRSWFTFRHIPTALTFEAVGNHVKQKPPLPNDPTVQTVRVKDVWSQQEGDHYV